MDNAKIEELYLGVVGTYHRVVWLYVAMGNPATLQKASRSSQLGNNRTNLSGLQSAANASQRERRQSFHCHEKMTKFGALPCI